jgi:hypothetical protein
LWFGANSFFQTIRGSFVQQIEQAKDAMRMEEVVELFSAAFAQVCALKVIDKIGENSLTQELTAAEITAVFSGTRISPSGASTTSTASSSITLGSFLKRPEANQASAKTVHSFTLHKSNKGRTQLSSASATLES